MNKLTNADVEQQLVRRRIAAVREERLAKLQEELLDQTIDRIETDLTTPLLCGPVPAIIATTALLFTPLLSMMTMSIVAPTAPVGLLFAFSLGTGAGVAKLGARWWARREESRGLPFRDLMIWTWVRHRRAEQRLTANAQLLGLTRSGWRVKSVTLGSAERLAVLFRLNAALELKDPYTLGHSRRVETHSYRIALVLGVASHDIEGLRRAAALHDIGKLTVPDQILRKPGALTARERDMINRHSIAGADILGILDDPAIVATVRSHHERWDGRGYPDGLVGDNIPLAARVIAVADTYDAITSARPYRAALRRKHALSILKAEAGHQFDPQVVNAFIPTLRPSGLVALVALWLTIPKEWVARLASAIKDSVAATAVPGAAVAGTALVLAASVATLLGPPGSDAVLRAAAPAPAEASIPDLVLGTRIVRPAVPPDERVVPKKDPKKPHAEARPNQRADKSAVLADGRSTPTADGPSHAVPLTREKVSSSAPLDPQGEKGRDCSNLGNPGTKGGVLHCGP